MPKKSFLDKIKGFFIEEVKTNDVQPDKFIDEDLDEINNDNEVKLLINEVICGRNKKKEDIIKALKNCEECYFDQEKELEIITSIGELQNDYDVLEAFVDETSKYGRFDNNHNQITRARDEARKKMNQLLLDDVLEAGENSYTNKAKIKKLLTLIKNEQIQGDNKEELQEIIIHVYNNINDKLYDDINTIDALHQVFDNKMRNVDDEVNRVTRDLKKKIDVYYNTVGTKEDKINAIRRISMRKISKKEDEELFDNTLEFVSDNTLDGIKEGNKIDFDKPEETDFKVNEEDDNNLEETTDNSIEELEEVDNTKDTDDIEDYGSILEEQGNRIMSSDLPLEEKEKLIKGLYSDFEAYVDDNIKTK